MKDQTKNQKCINLFAELLDKETTPERFRSVLSGLYFNYSRLLIKHGEDFGLIANEDTDAQLYYLKLLIEIADPETEYPQYPALPTNVAA